MKTILYKLSGLVIWFLSQELWAQSVSDNGSVIPYKRLRITPAFVFTDIDYDVARSSDDFSVDSEVLGVEVGKGVGSKFDLTGQFLYQLKAELDNCDGNGFSLGGGSHWEAHREKLSRIIVNGQLSYARQSFSCPNKAKLRNSLFELSAGATYDYRLHQDWDIFGGLRLTPIGHGTGKNETNGVNYEFKRDSIFNIVLGGSTRLAGHRLRAELMLFGETTFILGYSINL